LLDEALTADVLVTSTGIVLQELLQGFRGPRAKNRIIEAFGALPLIIPDREDHIEAAGLRNACRRRGVQAGTVDALLAQLCIRHDLRMLTADKDFQRIARHSSLHLAI
jgi:predicted nucleic acid-binding protein